MLVFIADSNTSALRTGDDDITGFLAPSKFQLCCRVICNFERAALLRINRSRYQYI